MAAFHRVDEEHVAWHCPGCRGGHMVRISAGGWRWNGDYERPTLEPSILVNVGGSNPTAPICHTFIREGMIQFLSDCTHELAGQIVPVPDWDE